MAKKSYFEIVMAAAPGLVKNPTERLFDDKEFASLLKNLKVSLAEINKELDKVKTNDELAKIEKNRLEKYLTAAKDLITNFTKIIEEYQNKSVIGFLGKAIFQTIASGGAKTWFDLPAFRDFYTKLLPPLFTMGFAANNQVENIHKPDIEFIARFVFFVGSGGQVGAYKIDSFDNDLFSQFINQGNHEKFFKEKKVRKTFGKDKAINSLELLKEYYNDNNGEEKTTAGEIFRAYQAFVLQNYASKFGSSKYHIEKHLSKEAIKADSLMVLQDFIKLGIAGLVQNFDLTTHEQVVTDNLLNALSEFVKTIHIKEPSKIVFLSPWLSKYIHSLILNENFDFLTLETIASLFKKLDISESYAGFEKYLQQSRSSIKEIKKQQEHFLLHAENVQSIRVLQRLAINFIVQPLSAPLLNPVDIERMKTQLSTANKRITKAPANTEQEKVFKASLLGVLSSLDAYLDYIDGKSSIEMSAISMRRIKNNLKPETLAQDELTFNLVKMAFAINGNILPDEKITETLTILLKFSNKADRENLFARVFDKEEIIWLAEKANIFKDNKLIFEQQVASKFQLAPIFDLANYDSEDQDQVTKVRAILAYYALPDILKLLGCVDYDINKFKTELEAENLEETLTAILLGAAVPRCIAKLNSTKFYSLVNQELLQIFQGFIQGFEDKKGELLLLHPSLSQIILDKKHGRVFQRHFFHIENLKTIAGTLRLTMLPADAFQLAKIPKENAKDKTPETDILTIEKNVLARMQLFTSPFLKETWLQDITDLFLEIKQDLNSLEKYRLKAPFITIINTLETQINRLKNKSVYEAGVLGPDILRLYLEPDSRVNNDLLKAVLEILFVLHGLDLKAIDDFVHALSLVVAENADIGIDVKTLVEARESFINAKKATDDLGKAKENIDKKADEIKEQAIQKLKPEATENLKRILNTHKMEEHLKALGIAEEELNSVKYISEVIILFHGKLIAKLQEDSNLPIAQAIINIMTGKMSKLKTLLVADHNANLPWFNDNFNQFIKYEQLQYLDWLEEAIEENGVAFGFMPLSFTDFVVEKLNTKNSKALYQLLLKEAGVFSKLLELREKLVPYTKEHEAVQLLISGNISRIKKKIDLNALDENNILEHVSLEHHDEHQQGQFQDLNAAYEFEYDETRARELFTKNVKKYLVRPIVADLPYNMMYYFYKFNLLDNYLQHKHALTVANVVKYSLAMQLLIHPELYKSIAKQQKQVEAASCRSGFNVAMLAPEHLKAVAITYALYEKAAGESPIKDTDVCREGSIQEVDLSSRENFYEKNNDSDSDSDSNNGSESYMSLSATPPPPTSPTELLDKLDEEARQHNVFDAKDVYSEPLQRKYYGAISLIFITGLVLAATVGVALTLAGVLPLVLGLSSVVASVIYGAAFGLVGGLLSGGLGLLAAKVGRKSYEVNLDDLELSDVNAGGADAHLDMPLGQKGVHRAFNPAEPQKPQIFPDGEAISTHATTLPGSQKPAQN